jgi:tetratricopeptide (TPR) repeat protein/serine/threonine protein kinase
MLSSLRNVSGNSSADSFLMRLLDEIGDRVQAGESVDVEAYAQAHPEYAERLRQLLPAVRMMANLGRSAASGEASVPPSVTDDGPVAATLGDFRILREVGRGGMGVVYEAEQLSLGRRVALKVLPFAATMDPRHLQRFHNEARAAACLHHEHIVPVYAVGCERGVHYYAMQFIDGLTLAQFLTPRGKAPLLPEQKTPVALPPLPDRTTAETAVAEAATTASLPRDRAEFRRIAEWGIQAASALEHAHQLGIVHRDVKPGNLMLDGQGKLWVTDFGLARMGGDAGLTQTGDLVGTLRYMSPEQALAKRGLVDHRTDIYSLGATLYEVLALRPAFPGNDRQDLLRQIAFEESKAPRRVNRAIPTELETVVLKAMEKNPADRYATAQGLADDLRNWLEDRPIKARRPGVGVRLAKWARRHRAAVVAMVLCLVMALAAVVGSVGWVLGERASRQERDEARVREALEEGGRRLQAGNPYDPVLIATVQQAQAQVDAGELDPDLQGRVRQLGRNLDMLRKLEEARLQPAAAGKGEGFDFAGADRLYAEAFQAYGLEVAFPDKAAEQVRTAAIRTQLVVALDNWAHVRNALHKGSGASLAAVAERADDDPWRQGLRRAVTRGDRIALEGLAKEPTALRQPPASIALLSLYLRPIEKEGLLRAVQQHRPEDFWINFHLAATLRTKEPPDPGQAIGYYRAALTLRPQSPTVHNNRGTALDEQGKLVEAMVCYRKAIELDPKYAIGHFNLGSALHDKGDVEGAIKAYQEALRLKQDYPDAHYGLGLALYKKGDLPGAIKEYRAALDLKKGYPEAHNNLGLALKAKGDVDGAIQEYREALRYKKDYAEAHLGLGVVLCDQKRDYKEAIKEFQAALRLKKDYAEARHNLGVALYQEGDVDAAIQAYQEALRLKKDYPDARRSLGVALKAKGDLAGAIQEYREALRLQNDDPETHYNLGLALRAQGRFVEALAAFRHAAEFFALSRPDDAQRAERVVHNCERLIALEKRLPALQAGKEQPKDNPERIALAELCTLKRLYCEAVRFYEEAFVDQPDLARDMRQGHRYNAACAAFLAGSGQGKDADQSDAKERSRLRRQALEWLRADVAAYRRRLEKEPNKAGSLVRQRMRHWQLDSDFAGVRGHKDLAKLPEAERQAWQQLWADVADLLAHAKATATPQKRPDGK